MTDQTVEHCIYLSDYVDENMPYIATLDGIAEWLSSPDPVWDREEAATDGQEFKAFVTDVRDHLATAGEDGELSFYPILGRYQYLIKREPGCGWDVDDMVDTIEGMRDHLAWSGITSANVAAMCDRPGTYIVTYHAATDDKPAHCTMREVAA